MSIYLIFSYLSFKQMEGKKYLKKLKTPYAQQLNH